MSRLGSWGQNSSLLTGLAGPPSGKGIINEPKENLWEPAGAVREPPLHLSLFAKWLHQAAQKFYGHLGKLGIIDVPIHFLK